MPNKVQTLMDLDFAPARPAEYASRSPPRGQRLRPAGPGGDGNAWRENRRHRDLPDMILFINGLLMVWEAIHGSHLPIRRGRYVLERA